MTKIGCILLSAVLLTGCGSAEKSAAEGDETKEVAIEEVSDAEKEQEEEKADAEEETAEEIVDYSVYFMGSYSDYVGQWAPEYGIALFIYLNDDWTCRIIYLDSDSLGDTSLRIDPLDGTVTLADGSSPITGVDTLDGTVTQVDSTDEYYDEFIKEPVSKENGTALVKARMENGDVFYFLLSAPADLEIFYVSDGAVMPYSDYLGNNQQTELAAACTHLTLNKQTAEADSITADNFFDYFEQTVGGGSMWYVDYHEDTYRNYVYLKPEYQQYESQAVEEWKDYTVTITWTEQSRQGGAEDITENTFSDDFKFTYIGDYGTFSYGFDFTDYSTIISVTDEDMEAGDLGFFEVTDISVEMEQALPIFWKQ